MNLYLIGYIYIFCVTFYYFIYGIYLFLNSKKFLSELSKNNPIFHSIDKPVPYFVILVPVLREQKLVESALKHLSNLDYDLNKLKIIVITTERELEEKSSFSKESTIDIVERIIPDLNQKLRKKVFFHSHFPFSKGVKSDQLNYALAKLEKENPTIFKKKNYYLGLYDVDSVSKIDILKVISKEAIENNFSLVYQQPRIYLKNYDFLPANFQGWFMKSFALLQTRYALGYEISMFLDSNSNKMKYCIGHGLWVRMDFLKKVGFFPTPIEDTRFGHICSYLRKSIKSINSVSVTEVPQKISTLLKQNSVWFTGESYILEDLKLAAKIGEVTRHRAIILTLYKYFRNFIWATEGILFFLVIGLGFYLPYQRLTLPFIFLSLIIYIYLPVFYLFRNRKIVSKLNVGVNFHPDREDYFLALFFLPIVVFSLWLGPQMAIIRLFKNMFTDSDALLPKTER